MLKNICYIVTGFCICLTIVFCFWFIKANKNLLGLYNQSNGDHAEIAALEKYLTDKGVLPALTPAK